MYNVLGEINAHIIVTYISNCALKCTKFYQRFTKRTKDLKGHEEWVSWKTGCWGKFLASGRDWGGGHQEAFLGHCAGPVWSECGAGTQGETGGDGGAWALIEETT